MAFNLKVRPTSGGTWVNLPIPDYNGGYVVEIYDVDAPTTGRDQSGLMHRDRVTVKRKVNCTWSNRKASEIRTILNSAIKNVFFSLNYWDPMSNSYVTGTFYVGDRSAPVFSNAVGAETIVGSFTADFIER